MVSQLSLYFSPFQQVAVQNFLSVTFLQLALKRQEGSQCIPKEFLILGKKGVHQKSGFKFLEKKIEWRLLGTTRKDATAHPWEEGKQEELESLLQWGKASPLELRQRVGEDRGGA